MLLTLMSNLNMFGGYVPPVPIPTRRVEEPIEEHKTYGYPANYRRRKDIQRDEDDIFKIIKLYFDRCQ